MYQEGMVPAEILYRCGDHTQFRERDVWRVVYLVEFVGGVTGARIMRAIDPPEPQEITDDYLKFIMSNLVYKPDAVPVYLGIDDPDLSARCRALKAQMPIRRPTRSTHRLCIRKQNLTDEEIYEELTKYTGNCPFEFAERIGYARTYLKHRISKSKLQKLKDLAHEKTVYAKHGKVWAGKLNRRTKKMYEMWVHGHTYTEIAARYGVKEKTARAAVYRACKNLGVN
jgi:hypothetical protein